MARIAPSTLILIPLLGLFWGFNWPAVRIALDEIPPWTLRAVGPALAAVCLMAVVKLSGQSLRVRREHWPRLVVAAILSVGAFNVLLAFAQLAGSTSRAAILTFTMPVWAAILARFTLGEAFDRQRVTGLALGITGLSVLGAPLLFAGVPSLGLLLALLGSISWALGTIVIKRWPVAAAPLTIASWQLVVAAGFAGIGMLVFEGVPVPRPLAPRTIAAFAFHVLGAQALAYSLWIVIISRLPAGVASLGTLMVPAVGVIASVLLLGEHPSLTDWIGLALVVAASATILMPRPVPAPA